MRQHSSIDVSTNDKNLNSEIETHVFPRPSINPHPATNDKNLNSEIETANLTGAEIVTLLYQ